MSEANPQQGETLEICANCCQRIVLLGNKWLHSDRALLGPEDSRQCWLFATRRAADAGPREDAVEVWRAIEIINRFSVCRDHDQPSHCVQCDLRHKAIAAIRAAATSLESEQKFFTQAEATLQRQSLIAIQQLTKARGFAAHTEEAGEVCTVNCEGCNDPVGQIIREFRAATSSPAPAESVCAKCGGSGEIEIGCAMDHALTAPCVECRGTGTVTTAPAESTRVEGEQERVHGWILGSQYEARGYYEEGSEGEGGEPWYVTDDGMHWSAFDVQFFPDHEFHGVPHQNDPKLLLCDFVFHHRRCDRTKQRHDQLDAILKSATSSDSARRAAEEIRNYVDSLICAPPMREFERAEIERIISKHFANAPADNDAESLLKLGDQKGRERAIKALRESRTTTKGDR